MKVSIIICTYNRALYLPVCLEHLKNQDADPADFEIVIVDNNSTDETEQISRRFIGENPALSIIYVLEKNPGLSHARNKGIETVTGDILCFIDDDGFASPDYVNTVLKFASDPQYNEYVAFGGKVIPCYNPGKEPEWLSPYIEGLVSKLDYGNEVKPFPKKYPAGCNMIFRKEFFEQHGGFNTDLHTRGDDKFVFIKLKTAGLRVLYVPYLRVDHFIDDYRLEKSFIKRLSKVIGQSESIRLREASIFTRAAKFLEYVFKFLAALLISMGFLIKGELSKAKYVTFIRWNVIKGFFSMDSKV